jgi:hypothetical protein
MIGNEINFKHDCGQRKTLLQVVLVFLPLFDDCDVEGIPIDN